MRFKALYDKSKYKYNMPHCGNTSSTLLVA